MRTALATSDTASFEALAEAEQRAMREIIALVRARLGVDFSHYRSGTLCRRVRNRMISAGIETYERYAEYLRASGTEALRLLERVTIKVSRFYRYVASFDCLRHTLLPQLAAARAGTPLRIACLGCGNGEEAYTFAALLEEAQIPGTIDASDIDPHALELARRGMYAHTAVESLPEELRAICLETVEGDQRFVYRVRDRIRARVRFHTYDLTSGAPPPGGSPFDVVSCQNVLIYLQPPAQERIAWMMRNALARDGLLCVGEAEWPPASVSGTLRTVSHSTRVFQAI
jgi:chemotaxis methyl-accepting protein methylase